LAPVPVPIAGRPYVLDGRRGRALFIFEGWGRLRSDDTSFVFQRLRGGRFVGCSRRRLRRRRLLGKASFAGGRSLLRKPALGSRRWLFFRVQGSWLGMCNGVPLRGLNRLLLCGARTGRAGTWMRLSGCLGLCAREGTRAQEQPQDQPPEAR
jgi:hypothetical protein